MGIANPLPVPYPAAAFIVNPDRFRGAVITQDGREYPIDDGMVIAACNALANIRYPFASDAQNVGTVVYSVNT